MKTFLSRWASTIVIALFIAVMAGGVIPATFPKSAFVVKPVLCPGGDMTTESQTYHPEPGRTVIARTFFCSSEGAPRREIGSLLVAGTCMAAAFIPALIASIVLTGGPDKPAEADPYAEAESKAEPAASGDLARRLKELSEARDAGLISDEEFEEKKQGMIDAL